MVSFRTFVLTIMGTCTLSMFSSLEEQRAWEDRVAQAAATGNLYSDSRNR